MRDLTLRLPYNGKDDDCNAATVDDDLDGDTYPIATDCNDTDAAVNPGAEEILDNGIDDDCNPATADETTHIGDIEASSYTSGKKKWKAIVNLTVHDSNENVVPNAEISGTWSGGTSSNGSCITDINGSCSLTNLPTWNSDITVTFTVENISHANMSYDPSANHDLDGDSDGFSITVNVPI